MKRLISAIAAVLLAVFYTIPVFAETAGDLPSIVADAYVVMDADTGQILVEKNMDGRHFPASVTKVLTVALGLEHGDFDDIVTVDASAVSSAGSHIALQAGEQLTLRDLSYAAMLPSANDAATAIGIYTAGSTSAFATMMNAKAKELGCTDTNFVNASGMPDDNHYTTARDMALITKYALTVPGFAEVFGGVEYLVPPTNKQKYTRQWGTDHMMFVTSAFYYEGALGGKLGWTEDAQHTAVTLAERDNMRLICVVLKDTRYDKFRDSIALFDYCFNTFRPVMLDGTEWEPQTVTHSVTDDSNEQLLIYGSDTYRILLPNGVTASEVKAEFDMATHYSQTDIVNPMVRLSVGSNISGMHHEIGAFPLQVSLASDSIATSNNFNREPTLFGSAALRKILIALGTIGALVLTAALGLVVIRYVNKYRSWKRRQARIARLRRYNDPTLEMRPPPPSSPPRTARPLPSRTTMSQPPRRYR